MTFAVGISHTPTQRWLWQYTSGYGKSSTMWRSFDMAVPHVLAKAVDAVPEASDLAYEPKWDGWLN
ncbi:hypothetical protein ACGFIH_26695 [Micromonospora parva]|uniref:hypothetical protein n=1 Tax=Micromonospora parva TaxID=1464048 RepID=UPI00371B9C45